MTYVRFQGTVRDPRGHFPGVFALANGLARQGVLTDEQWSFWRAGNDWYDANYPDPSTVDPHVYDPELHPGAVAWFKTSAHHGPPRLRHRPPAPTNSRPAAHPYDSPAHVPRPRPVRATQKAPGFLPGAF
ncbi:hypothetical protein [Streptomyces sp. NPDC092295]|uniref:hypothetical protein n=1 Tax=Streptomyces sp. NPDC092295 TaxID=3366011 RepID=UPI0037FEFC6A